MEYALSKNKKIVSAVFIALGFFVLGLLPFSKAYAQPVIITEADDIRVTASVPGCGDNFVQTALGEQCEGPNTAIKKLNGQTCYTLGFATGTLGCRNTCIFDTSLCTGVANPSSGGGSSTGSKIRDTNDVFRETDIPNISATNLIFNGKAGPGDVIVIMDGNTYFASGIAASDGTFSIVVSDFVGNTYNFNFYATSQEFGKSLPLGFKAIVRENTTTQISNINLLYPEKTTAIGLTEKIEEKIEEKMSPLFDVLLVNILEPERPLFPFVVIVLSGFGLLALFRFILFLIRITQRRYIDHYER